MNSRVSGLLGICRKANKMSMGHDACKGSVNSGKAKLCLLSSDASERIYDEFCSLCSKDSIPVFRISLTINEIHRLIGYKAGVITINDGGFADSVIKHITTESTSGEEGTI
ncbi:MAG: L7Ae/L30e/S12e/Gadd45 family ribosomal protein [Acutalibacteraceae bacterium]